MWEQIYSLGGKIMGAMIGRQPNGRLCRYSTIVDSITHSNMTDEEYVEYCKERAEEEAWETIARYCKSWDTIVEEVWNTDQMTVEEKQQFIAQAYMEVKDGYNDI